MNRKGVSGETVVLIVVAIVLGVVIILFASGVIKADQFKPWISSGSSLTTKGQQCKVACSAGDKDNWCINVGVDDKIKLTESQWAGVGVTDPATDGDKPLKIGTTTVNAKAKGSAVYDISCDGLSKVKLIQTTCELAC